MSQHQISPRPLPPLLPPTSPVDSTSAPASTATAMAETQKPPNFPPPNFLGHPYRRLPQPVLPPLNIPNHAVRPDFQFRSPVNQPLPAIQPGPPPRPPPRSHSRSAAPVEKLLAAHSYTPPRLDPPYSPQQHHLQHPQQHAQPHLQQQQHQHQHQQLPQHPSQHSSHHPPQHPPHHPPHHPSQHPQQQTYASTTSPRSESDSRPSTRRLSERYVLEEPRAGHYEHHHQYASPIDAQQPKQLLQQTQQAQPQPQPPSQSQPQNLPQYQLLPSPGYAPNYPSSSAPARTAVEVSRRTPPSAVASIGYGEPLTVAPPPIPRMPPSTVSGAGPVPRIPDRPNLKYDLVVRQQPIAARACGFGERDRRVIDPPPIIQLLVTNVKTGQVDTEEIRYSHNVVHCTLWSADGTSEETSLMQPDRRQTRRLMGQLVASPSVAKDEHDAEGFLPSSALTRALKLQGCNIQVKKGNDKIRKRIIASEDLDDDDGDDKDFSQGKRRRKDS